MLEWLDGTAGRSSRTGERGLLKAWPVRAMRRVQGREIIVWGRGRQKGSVMRGWFLKELVYQCATRIVLRGRGCIVVGSYSEAEGGNLMVLAGHWLWLGNALGKRRSDGTIEGSKAPSGLRGEGWGRGRWRKW
jgi:hypothetical protein